MGQLGNLFLNDFLDSLWFGCELGLGGRRRESNRDRAVQSPTPNRQTIGALVRDGPPPGWARRKSSFLIIYLIPFGFGCELGFGDRERGSNRDRAVQSPTPNR